MIRKAVIPAAGFGTRMLPAAKAVPKELLPVLDRPTIQYVVEEAAEAGVDDVLLVTSRDKKAVEDHFDRSPELEQRLAAGGKEALLASVNALAEDVQVHAVRQATQKGLGDAVNQARRHVGDAPFLCLLGDTIFSSPLSSRTAPSPTPSPPPVAPATTPPPRLMPRPEELKGRPLGRVLTRMGRLSREQVVQALDRQKRTGGKLGEVLVQMGFVRAEDIEAALAAQRGQPVATTPPPAAPPHSVPLPAQQLADAYRELKTTIIGLEEVPAEKVSRYGVVGGTAVRDGVLRLDTLVEKPSPQEAPSRFAIAARYVLTPAIFDCLDATPPGKGGEVQLTDALRLLLKREPVHGVVLHSRRHDIGNPVDWLKTNLLFAARDEQTWAALRPLVESLARGDR
jgi:UTP--glucose-1-phosphate uridylyltransferase